MNNEKRVVLLSLTILALLLTGFTWAYWTNTEVKGVSKDFTNTIKISAAEDIEVDTKLSLLSENDSLKLVPKKFVVEGESTNKATVFYDLLWEEETNDRIHNVADGTLAYVKISDIKIDLNGQATDETIKEMFDVDVSPYVKTIALGRTFKDAIGIQVVFKQEPGDQHIYNELVKNGLNISFKISVLPDRQR
ncbi:MAG TPA: hypothetical protein VIG45_05760 [Erysipelothrix sp.]